MRKRGVSGSVPGRRFTNLVLESFGRGLTVEEIVDDLRSKHGEWSRCRRNILMIKVKNIVKSRSKDVEESNGVSKKKLKRDGDLCISSLSSDSSDDVTRFDITNDSLRDSYSDKSRKKNDVCSEEGSKGYDIEVKGPTFKDLGGLKGVLDELRFIVKLPLLCPDLVQAIGMKSISGLLLHGPPGCGKSTLACAIANEAGVPFYMVSAAELVSGVSGITSLLVSFTLVLLCSCSYSRLV